MRTVAQRIRPALLLIPLYIGCAGAEAVSVSGTIGNVQLEVQQQLLVTELSGGFDVFLELGQRSSDPADITFSSFSLIRLDTGAPALSNERLSVVSSHTMPVHVDPGGQIAIHFTIGDDKSGTIEPMTVEASEREELCGAGQLQITATFQDTITPGRDTPLRSAPFVPSGC